MGLFENLFKPRPEGSAERVVEAPLKGPGAAEKAGESETELDPRNVFLHPKGYAAGSGKPTLGGQNQGFVPVLPAAKKAHPHERRASVPEPPPGAEDEIVLTIGDVLPRIPVALLRPGPRDLKRELRFHIDHLSSDMARGRPAIALSVIAQQCPDLFHSRISDEEDMEIRLPLQKLVEQVGRIRARAPAAPAPHVPHRAPAIASPPVVHLPVPAAEQTRPAPLHEAASAPPPSPFRAPAFSPPATGSQPVVEPAAEEARVSPRAEPGLPVGDTRPPPPPEAVPTAEDIRPPQPVPSPAPVEPPPSAAVAPVVAPERAAPIASEPSPAPEPSIPEKVPDEVSSTPVPTPVRREEIAPPGSVIELGLAAVVAKLPREMLAGEVPHISESERISLPFPMIERQLGTGVVEVPAKLLWSALPPLLKHHFIQREGLSVVLPLEEIFQNLPVGGVGAKLRFDAPLTFAMRPPEADAPIVLAPAVLREEEAPQLDFEPPPPIAPKTVAEPPVPERKSVASAAPEQRSPEAIEKETADETGLAASGETSAAPAGRADFSSDIVALPEPVSAEDVAGEPVHLQPFRVFTPVTLAVEAKSTEDVAGGEPVVLGDVLPLAQDEAAQILRAVPAGEESAATAGEAGSEATAPFPLRLLERPEDTDAPQPRPAPPRVVFPPDPEPLVAFAPDQPPPLKIEAPAFAVAELRATVPEPSESPMLASATTTVQPPRMFRPMVMPPPIASQATPAAINLAPTLGGPAASGMITLAAALQGAPPPVAPASPVISAPPVFAAPPIAPAPRVVEPEAPPRAPEAIAPKPIAEEPTANPEPEPAPPATVEAPASEPRETAPTLKSLVRRLFAGAEEHVESVPPAPPVAEPAPVVPAAPAPVPAVAPSMPSLFPSGPSEPMPPSVATAADGSAFHLSLPPLPQPAAAPPAQNVPSLPALPISRFDQQSLQSVFMTEEILDLPKISRLAAALPGIQGCIIATRGETFTSGDLPQGFHLSALRGLLPQIGAAADRLPIGELKNFTLYGEDFSISFFERPSVCLCAIHRARSFIPGVRERLVTVADELARGERGMTNDE